MNLLVFVALLLTVLASMNYSALKIYLLQTFSQMTWTRYMEAYEGCVYNEKIEEVYKHFPRAKGEASPKLDSTGKKEDTEKNYSLGGAYINFRILTGSAKMEPSAYDLFDKLIKTLIVQNYGEAPFYKEAVEKRPNILEELLTYLKTLKEKKVNKAKALGNVDISDQDLKNLFYQLLRETPIEGKKACSSISLFDFLSDSSRTKISVYIAPKPILLALFGKPEIVDQIVEMREELYDVVKKDKKKVEESTLQFQAKFENQTDFREIVTFTVNTTNPKNY